MSEAYLGEIRLFAGNYAPPGWQLCNGSLLDISEYDALYALLGTTYGGDGVQKFALPDLRGRLPIGQGQAPGTSQHTLGTQIGTESVTLTSGQMPQHSHALSASGQATANTPAGMLPATVSGFNLYAPEPAATPVALAPASVTVVGDGQPHNNLMPSLVLSYIICLAGIFPSQG